MIWRTGTPTEPGLYFLAAVDGKRPRLVELVRVQPLSGRRWWQSPGGGTWVDGPGPGETQYLGPFCADDLLSGGTS